MDLKLFFGMMQWDKPNHRTKGLPKSELTTEWKYSLLDEDDDYYFRSVLAEEILCIKVRCELWW